MRPDVAGVFSAGAAGTGGIGAEASDVTDEVLGIKGRVGAFCPRATSAETRAEAGGAEGAALFVGWNEISSPVVGSMIANRRLAGLAAGTDWDDSRSSVEPAGVLLVATDSGAVAAGCGEGFGRGTNVGTLGFIW